MDWFKQHLNWTWVFCLLLTSLFSLILTLFEISGDAGSNVAYWVFLVAGLGSFVFFLVISGWVIKQKGHSLWWILLVGWFSPLWLSNIKTIVKEQIASLQDK